ncbi:MAG TPA: hypothetical protein VEG27_14745 [Usitatibacter sp.]|nr:hypothetical protein [Usitatibacter sp.]
MPARLLGCVLAAAALAAATARADGLGTLFFTPAERARLDQERRGEPVEASAPAAEGAHALTGYVERSDGHATIWIDGRPMRVPGPGARRALDPGEVSAYARSAEKVKVEREKAR